METVDLEMGDLFDNEAVGEDEDVGAYGGGGLPDFEEAEAPLRDDGDAGDGGEEEDGEEGVVANLKRLSKGAAKKHVMRPQPKLDADRLKSERGLALIPRIFQDVKFKGRGHETEDLKLMMGKLEHWAHRLFPKIPFDEFNDRMEKLQVKKPVQNTLNRIRLDMPLLDDEYIAQYEQPGADQEADQGAEPHEGADGENGRDYPEDVDPDEAFEAMMRQEREAAEIRRLEQAEDDAGLHDDDPWGKPTGKPTDNHTQRSPPPSPQPSKSPDRSEESRKENRTPSEKGKDMSVDVKARMEENRRKALEKRAARLGVPVSALMSPKPAPKSSDTKDSSATETTPDLASQKDCSQKDENISSVGNSSSKATEHANNSHSENNTEASTILSCQGNVTEETEASAVLSCQGNIAESMDTSQHQSSPEVVDKNPSKDIPMGFYRETKTADTNSNETDHNTAEMNGNAKVS